MLAIIGCGNLNRSDDGVGVVVARRLRDVPVPRVGPLVRIFDAGTGGMEVMFFAHGADKLVLVDASRSGAEAGAVFKVPGLELATDYRPAYSLHDFRWDHAIYAGRKIFGPAFPTDVTVFLIEAASLDFGFRLSEPVRRAGDRVVTEIERIIDAYVAARPA
ncbi:MAG: hydrogenase maturation protease [Pseudomonadota bacterium]